MLYPLAITQTKSVDVDIQILLLTTDYLWSYPELPKANIRVGSQRNPTAKSISQDTAVLSQTEVQRLSPDMDALFGHRGGIKLRSWKITPERLRGRFIHDLVAR